MTFRRGRRQFRGEMSFSNGVSNVRGSEVHACRTEVRPTIKVMLRE